MLKRLLLAALFCLLAQPVWAAIAFDASSCYAAGDPGDFGDITWDHVPSGTPAGVVVYITQGAQTNNNDSVIGITYGGDAMTELPSSPDMNASTPCCDAEHIDVIHAFFLSAPKSGTQAVLVDQETTSDYVWGCAITVTSATGASEVVIDGIIDLDNTDPNTKTVNLSLSSKTSFVSMGAMSGESVPANMSPVTGWTEADGTADAGSATYEVYIYDTIGSTDVDCSFTVSNDEAHALCSAITESSGAAAAPSQLLLMGVGD